MVSWKNLNESQKAAALHDKGPAAVYAGPGSGKTRVVALRAARLAERGADILVTTFTNDATEEMRARIKPMIPKGCPGSAHITTLHALCLAILRGRGLKFQLMADDAQRISLGEAALAGELEDGTNGFLTRQSFLKNSGESADIYQPDNSYEDREFAAVWKRYEKLKVERNLKEFDDLLLDVMRLFAREPEVLQRWSNRFTHVMVDECQDMNRPQYGIALALGRGHHNVMLVGDPDQSLYGFRGADSVTFKQFAKHPATKVYELRHNYRSTRSIISFADSLIRQDENRRPIVFEPTREDGAPVRWDRYADADVEALAVGEQIQKLAEKGARYRDMAVLFRLNAQAEAFERHFAALGIPFTAKRDGDFYARKEVAGIIAYMEFFCSYGDEWVLAFLNLPSRKLSRSVGAEMRRIAEFRGKTIWEILPEFTAPDLKSHKAVRAMLRELQHMEERMPGCKDAGEAVKLIRQTTDFDGWLRVEEMTDRDNDRIQNVVRMQEAASHYATVQEYVDAIRKVREENARRKADAKKKSQQEDAVTLATGHGAKGLEWKYVFAAGWNEELLPHRKAESVDEERRIAYVIATRARDYLAVSSLQNWNSATVAPSRFLTGLSLGGGASAEDLEIEIDPDEYDDELGGIFVV